MLELVPLPAFSDNYIWVLHNRHAALVIDPGDAFPVLQFIDRMNLELLAVLNTHHHADHTGGNAELRHRYQCRILGPTAESIPQCTHPVNDGDHLQFPELGLSFQVIATPGHTLGHVSYYGAGYLFCGDTLFGCGCGRLFEGTPQQMHNSLSVLARLSHHTLICCAHEYTLSNIRFAKSVDPFNPALLKREERDASRRAAGQPTLPSTLEIEAQTNPFLRCGEPAIWQSAERLIGHPLVDETDVFAVIRSAKDHFQA
jgi:hydroxyacylglutathione hydrolase